MLSCHVGMIRPKKHNPSILWAALNKSKVITRIKLRCIAVFALLIADAEGYFLGDKIVGNEIPGCFGVAVDVDVSSAHL